MSTYPYSHVYYNPQLPNPYNVYWYPPYAPPPMYTQPPVQYQRTPHHKRRDLTPSPPPDVAPHIILANRPRGLYWAVHNDPEKSTPYLPTAHSKPHHIPPSVLGEPATDPPTSTMRIVCDDFQWTISISVPGPVTVRHVLGAIYGTLQEPLAHHEWEEMRGNARKNAHKTRCMRVASGPARFAIGQEAGAVKKTDTLGDRVIFLGLIPIGPKMAPHEWLLKLGPATERGR